MKLFGGAITADIPPTLVDASYLREIPDNQEVFVGVVESSNVSLIIELLEAVPHPNINDALAIHVEEVHRMAGVPPEERDEPLLVQTLQLGDHLVSSRVDVTGKGDDREALVFALLRLTEYKTDVLITCIVKRVERSPLEKEMGTQTNVVFRCAETLKVTDAKLFAAAPHDLKASSAPNVE